MITVDTSVSGTVSQPFCLPSTAKTGPLTADPLAPARPRSPRSRFCDLGRTALSRDGSQVSPDEEVARRPRVRHHPLAQGQQVRDHLTGQDRRTCDHRARCGRATWVAVRRDQQAPGPVCQMCPAVLVRAADLVQDDWVWVHGAGSRTGRDPDLAYIPGPYGHLGDLGVRALAGDMRAAQEYSALKARLDASCGYEHEHWPDPRQVTRYDDSDEPMPEHCGWPAWRRPSGWQCRHCQARLPVPGPIRQPAQTSPVRGAVRAKQRR
jgi:hypothetical protein